MKDRIGLAARAWSDPECEDFVVESVVTEENGYTISFFGGLTLFLGHDKNPDKIVPKEWDQVRIWWRGLGCPWRGLAINSNLICYQSLWEQKAALEKELGQRVENGFCFGQ